MHSFAKRKLHAAEVKRVTLKFVQQTLAEISEKFVLRIDASVLVHCDHVRECRRRASQMNPEQPENIRALALSSSPEATDV